MELARSLFAFEHTIEDVDVVETMFHPSFERRRAENDIFGLIKNVRSKSVS